MSDQGVSHKAVKEFLAEAEEIVDQFGSELADLADMAESGELSPDLLNSIFRAAHSLKGLAGMFGFSDIAELAHNMENMLDCLRLGKINPDQKLMKVLFGAHELLTSLVRSVDEDGSAARSADIAACVTQINACLAPPSTAPAAVSPLARLGLDERVLGALTEYEEHRLLDNLNKGKSLFSVHTSFELTTFDVELSQVSDILKTCGEVISTLPSMGGNLETHIDFDILFGSSRSLNEVKELIENNAVSVTRLGGGEPPAVAVVPVQEPLTVTSAVSRPVDTPRISSAAAAMDADTAVPAAAPSDDAALSAKSMSDSHI